MSVAKRNGVSRFGSNVYLWKVLRLMTSIDLFKRWQAFFVEQGLTKKNYASLSFIKKWPIISSKLYISY